MLICKTPKTQRQFNQFNQCCWDEARCDEAQRCKWVQMGGSQTRGSSMMLWIFGNWRVRGWLWSFRHSGWKVPRGRGKWVKMESRSNGSNEDGKTWQRWTLQSYLSVFNLMAWSCCGNRWHKLVLAALLNHFRHFWRQSLTLWWVYLRCSWKRIVGMVESQSNSSSALRRNCEWELFFQLFGPLLDPEKRLKHTDSDPIISHLRLSLAVLSRHPRLSLIERIINESGRAVLLACFEEPQAALEPWMQLFSIYLRSRQLTFKWHLELQTCNNNRCDILHNIELYDMCVLHCFAICECVCSILQYCNKSASEEQFQPKASLLWVGII